MGQAPPAAPMPIRLMDSTPPPMVMSCCPDMISAAAKLTASSPEAQKRLIYLDARHAIAVARRECRHAPPAVSAPTAAFPPPASPIESTQSRTTSSSRVELIALLQRRQRLRRQIERGHLVQRAICLAAPSWRANVIVDEGVRHRVSVA